MINKLVFWIFIEIVNKIIDGFWLIGGNFRVLLFLTGISNSLLKLKIACKKDCKYARWLFALNI